MISRRELMVGASVLAVAAALPAATGYTFNGLPVLSFRGIPLDFDTFDPPEYIFCDQSVLYLIEDKIRRGG